MSHVAEGSPVQEHTQDAVRGILQLTSSVVHEVKATAGSGGSIMTASSKLEEV